MNYVWNVCFAIGLLFSSHRWNSDGHIRIARVTWVFGAYYLYWGFTYGSIVTIVMGVIAIIGAKSVNTLVWAIILIIVGAIGGGLGGILVILGGLIGIITVVSKKA